MTQKENATLEKVFDELRTLTTKVQNIEDAILGSDYFGEGIKAQTLKNSEDILRIENKFKYIYYTLIGICITGGWQLSELIKKILPVIF
tara:strand:+ start:16717 stop:16983 length:267 start_codon:yes stop_codon:yes gene_type:complete